MMNDLPKGWKSTQLGALVQLKTGPFGSALHQSDYVQNGTPLINPTHIRGGRLYPDSSVSASSKKADELKDFKLAAGDVVLGRRGEMGRCAVVPESAAGWLCGTGSVVVRPTEAVRPAFLQKFLSAPTTVSALVGDSVGSTMVNLNQKILLGLPFNLPPLAEQTRIADKLDAVLTRVDAVNTRLARVAPILKRFRQSVLAAATSGRLTEDWRKCNPLFMDDANKPPIGWRIVKFKDVCKEITVGFVGKMSDQYVDSGVPFLRSMNVRPFRFDPTGLQYISQSFHTQIFKSRLNPGDLAIVRSGAPGVCCVVPDSIGEANCSDLVIARPGSDLLAEYGCIYMNSSFGAAHVASKLVGVAQAHFNVGSMKETPFPLPSLEEQTEIVRRVETLFAFADRLEARLQAAQTAAQRLTPALLAKAFRGELVPQDPNDEPASELLRRLQASPPVSAPKRGRKPAA